MSAWLLFSRGSSAHISFCRIEPSGRSQQKKRNVLLFSGTAGVVAAQVSHAAAKPSAGFRSMEPRTALPSNSVLLIMTAVGHPSSLFSQLIFPNWRRALPATFRCGWRVRGRV